MSHFGNLAVARRETSENAFNTSPSTYFVCNSSLCWDILN